MLIITFALVGTGFSVLTTRLIKGSLYGVQPLDPITFATAAAVLAGVGTFASLIPALRLLWLNPSYTLRQE